MQQLSEIKTQAQGSKEANKDDTPTVATTTMNVGEPELIDQASYMAKYEAIATAIKTVSIANAKQLIDILLIYS